MTIDPGHCGSKDGNTLSPLPGEKGAGLHDQRGEKQAPFFLLLSRLVEGAQGRAEGSSEHIPPSPLGQLKDPEWTS